MLKIPHSNNYHYSTVHVAVQVCNMRLYVPWLNSQASGGTGSCDLNRERERVYGIEVKYVCKRWTVHRYVYVQCRCAKQYTELCKCLLIRKWRHCRAVATSPVSVVSTGPLFPSPTAYLVLPSLLSGCQRKAPNHAPNILKLAKGVQTV